MELLALLFLGFLFFVAIKLFAGLLHAGAFLIALPFKIVFAILGFVLAIVFTGAGLLSVFLVLFVIFSPLILVFLLLFRHN